MSFHGQCKLAEWYWDLKAAIFINSRQTHGVIFVLMTLHLSIKSVNDPLDAQLFYFIVRLLQSSTCFEQGRAHHQEVKLY